jgi:hypothetical protein
MAFPSWLAAAFPIPRMADLGEDDPIRVLV